MKEYLITLEYKNNNNTTTTKTTNMYLPEEMAKFGKDLEVEDISTQEYWEEELKISEKEYTTLTIVDIKESI